MTVTTEPKENKVGKAAKSAQKKEAKRERKAQTALHKSLEEKNITESLFIGTRVKHSIPTMREPEPIPVSRRVQFQKRFPNWNAHAINALFEITNEDASAVDKFIGDLERNKRANPFLKDLLRETEEKLIQQALSAVFKATHEDSPGKENYNAEAVQTKISSLRDKVLAAEQLGFSNWIKSEMARSTGDEQSARRFEELAKQQKIRLESILKMIYTIIFKKSSKRELDLHFLHVREARIATKIFLNNSVVKDTRRKQPKITIITGRGKHSEGGIPKLRPEVESILKGANIPHQCDVGSFSFYPPTSLVV